MVTGHLYECLLPSWLIYFCFTVNSKFGSFVSYTLRCEGNCHRQGPGWMSQGLETVRVLLGSESLSRTRPPPPPQPGLYGAVAKNRRDLRSCGQKVTINLGSRYHCVALTAAGWTRSRMQARDGAVSEEGNWGSPGDEPHPQTRIDDPSTPIRVCF